MLLDNGKQTAPSIVNKLPKFQTFNIYRFYDIIYAVTLAYHKDEPATSLSGSIQRLGKLIRRQPSQQECLTQREGHQLETTFVPHQSIAKIAHLEEENLVEAR